MASVRKGLGTAEIAADLRKLGLTDVPGVLVHCSMDRIGYMIDGAATLFSAIIEVAGPRTTIVVPTHTANNSLSSRDFLAATEGFDVGEVEKYVAGMPAFDPAETPSYGMGKFAEYVRTRPGAVRSRHPQTSFAAAGPSATAWTAVHDDDCHMGERSPIRALYDAGAHILLAGVGFDQCTAFHLGEYRTAKRGPLRDYHCFVRGAAGRERLEIHDIHLDDEDFGSLGADFAATTTAVSPGPIGNAAAMAFPLRAAVDFATRWMDRNRPAPETLA
jgi:aminoglycoside 3-N-acetyltransferase